MSRFNPVKTFFLLSDDLRRLQPHSILNLNFVRDLHPHFSRGRALHGLQPIEVCRWLSTDSKCYPPGALKYFISKFIQQQYLSVNAIQGLQPLNKLCSYILALSNIVLANLS